MVTLSSGEQASRITMYSSSIELEREQSSKLMDSPPVLKGYAPYHEIEHEISLIILLSFHNATL